MTYRKLLTLFSILLVLSLVLVACGGADEEPTEVPAPAEEEAAPAEEEAAPAEEEAAPAEEEAAPAEEEMAEVDFAMIPGGSLEKAVAGEYAGTTVTVDGPFTDPDDVYFAQSMEAFEEATGITVTYIGDKEFEGRLSIAVDAGDPPDIADFPQPGLLANFARQGFVVDPTTWMSEDWLSQQYNQSSTATRPGASASSLAQPPVGQPPTGPKR
jgi:alpha-glucoside transport system substrate-binding protein